jgi:hypothetical protein
MTADGSMAVWSEHKAAASGATAEVHFNYWRLAGDATFVRATNGAAKDFVEVGVLLAKATEVEQVSIYLPGLPNVWTLEDCGPYFGMPEIAQGIFNEELTSNASSPPGPRRVDLLRPDQSIFCRVHIFPLSNATIDPVELRQTATDVGTLLTITRRALDEACVNLPSDTPVYFRLRAYCSGGSETSPFVKRIKPKDRFLQTGYSVVDYLDFRLNEARSLPQPIESLMRARPGARVPHTLVAFLTAVPVQSDVIASSWESHKKRLLEDNLWRTYVPAGIPQGMMVYHWREVATEQKPDVRDFTGFVKMQTRLVSWPVLLISIGLAFIFGVLGNLLASCIWAYSHGPAVHEHSMPASAQTTTQPKLTTPQNLDNSKSNVRPQ